MNEFVFKYERSPWELALDRLHRGDQISAARFLTLLEGEEEYAWEEAFQTFLRITAVEKGRSGCAGKKCW